MMQIIMQDEVTKLGCEINSLKYDLYLMEKEMEYLKHRFKLFKGGIFVLMFAWIFVCKWILFE